MDRWRKRGCSRKPLLFVASQKEAKEVAHGMLRHYSDTDKRPGTEVKLASYTMYCCIGPWIRILMWVGAIMTLYKIVMMLDSAVDVALCYIQQFEKCFT